MATENNTVYSLDLVSGSVLWKRTLGPPVNARTLPCGNIQPVTGITGTPAADPASGKLYVVAFLSGYQHVLFTLALSDGSVLGRVGVDPAGSNPVVEQVFNAQRERAQLVMVGDSAQAIYGWRGARDIMTGASGTRLTHLGRGPGVRRTRSGRP